MQPPQRKKKTLGRGMEDLLGSSLEGLLQEPPGSEPAPGRDAPTELPGAPPEEAAEAKPAILPPISARSTAPEASTRPREAPSLQREGSSGARVFAVASGKGGTGKSILTVNLAVALASRLRVCVVDADMALANAHILLGMLPARNVSHLLKGEAEIGDVLVEGPRGLLLLPGASGIPEMASLDDAKLARFASALTPLFARCDAALLDCPAGLSRQSLLLLHGADVVVLVTTDDLTSMTDVYALIKTVLAHRPRAALGIVVNEARTAADGEETYRKVRHVARKFLGKEIPLLGVVPRDGLLEHSVAERRPVILGHPSAPSALAISDLADRIWALKGPEPWLPFPERLKRTLAASAPAWQGAGDGANACAS